MFDFGDDPICQPGFHLGDDVLAGGKIPPHHQDGRIAAPPDGRVDIADNAIGEGRADPGQQHADPPGPLQAQMARRLVLHIADFRDGGADALARLDGNPAHKFLPAAQDIGNGRGRHIGALGNINNGRSLPGHNGRPECA